MAQNAAITNPKWLHPAKSSIWRKNSGADGVEKLIKFQAYVA